MQYLRICKLRKNTKVGDFNSSVYINKDIGRFDIAVKLVKEKGRKSVDL